MSFFLYNYLQGWLNCTLYNAFDIYINLKYIFIRYTAFVSHFYSSFFSFLLLPFTFRLFVVVVAVVPNIENTLIFNLYFTYKYYCSSPHQFYSALSSPFKSNNKKSRTILVKFIDSMYR